MRGHVIGTVIFRCRGVPPALIHPLHPHWSCTHTNPRPLLLKVTRPLKSPILVAWERAKFQLRERDNFLSQPARGSSSDWERWWKNWGTLSNRKYLLSIEGVCADKINTVRCQCSAFSSSECEMKKFHLGRAQIMAFFTDQTVKYILVNTFIVTFTANEKFIRFLLECFQFISFRKFLIATGIFL